MNETAWVSATLWALVVYLALRVWRHYCIERLVRQYKECVRCLRLCRHQALVLRQLVYADQDMPEDLRQGFLSMARDWTLLGDRCEKVIREIQEALGGYQARVG